MSEAEQEPSAILPTKPFSFSDPYLQEIFSPMLQEEEHVTINVIKPDDLFKKLSRMAREQPEQLHHYDNSLAVCPGGIFRSAKVDEYFEQIGVKRIALEGKWGFRIEDIATQLAQATINEQDINLKDFQLPLKRLFVVLMKDNEYEELALIRLLHALYELRSKNPGKPLALDIIVIDAHEADITPAIIKSNPPKKKATV